MIDVDSSWINYFIDWYYSIFNCNNFVTQIKSRQFEQKNIFNKVIISNISSLNNKDYYKNTFR